MSKLKRILATDLRAKIFLLLALMFTLLTGLTTFETLQEYQSAREERLRQFAWMARWVESEQHRHIAQARQVAFLAINEIRKGLTDEVCRQGVVGTPGLDPEYGRFALADPNGNVSCNSIPWLSAKNVAGRSYFEEAIKRHDVGFIDEADNRKPGQYAAIKAHAMRDRNGHVVKVILVAMDFSWAKEEVNLGRLPSSAHLLLLDASGTLIAGSPNMDPWVDKSIADTPFYQKLKTLKEGIYEGTGFAGQKSFIISHPLTTASGSLRVVIDIPRDTLLQPLYASLITKLLVSIAVFTIILALAFYWSNRYFLRKLAIIQSAAARLAEGDWTARANIAGSNEIARLGRSFDTMANALQDNEIALAATNDELYRVNRALHVLSAGNKALLVAKTEAELLDRVCRNIVEKGGYHTARVAFAGSKHDNYLRIAASHSKSGNEPSRQERDELDSLTEAVMIAVQEDRVLTLNDTNDTSIYGELCELARKSECRSIIILPLHREGKACGALIICAYRAHEFGHTQVDYLRETATDISFGIEMLSTRGERDRLALLEQGHETVLKDSLEDALRAIAMTIEMRDPYTAGHQRRVAELAHALAIELGLSDEEAHGIYLAAIVHDIGKINIPAEVLVKPGKLTDVEYALVKNHVDASYEILKGIEFPWPIADMVHQHHERMDGSGYPKGLAGGEILFGARILAVADVVEAMWSHRPYREGLGIKAALSEIERGRDTLYDASVADACVKLFREEGFEFERGKEE